MNTPSSTTSTRRSRSRRQARIGRGARAVAVFAILGVLLSPIAWMLWSAVHANSDLTVRPPGLGEITFENFERVLTTPAFLDYFRNSVIVSSGTVLLTLVVATLAAYAFSRFDFRGRSAAMVLVLSVQMFPVVAILVSLFDVYASLKLLNTYQGLILANTTMSLPFAIWFMTSFLDAVPRELDESARVDGAGRMRTLWSVLLPLTRPGLLAVGVYAFLMAWDDFVLALTLTTRDEYRTLPVGIAQSFIGEYSYDWSGMMTISVVTSIPILIVFLTLQRHMVAGLTQGAVKG